jgi:hypothetical protein
VALEAAPADTRLNTVGDEGVPLRDIAEVIDHHLNLLVTGISREVADGDFGLFTLFRALDAPASSALTQQQFGWHPAHPGLIAGLDEGHYFNDLVRVRDDRPGANPRTPRHVRGKAGTVVLHGQIPNPLDHRGRYPPLCTVRFGLHKLTDCPSRDYVTADLHEDCLEPAHLCS